MAFYKTLLYQNNMEANIIDFFLQIPQSKKSVECSVMSIRFPDLETKTNKNINLRTT